RETRPRQSGPLQRSDATIASLLSTPNQATTTAVTRSFNGHCETLKPTARARGGSTARDERLGQGGQRLLGRVRTLEEARIAVASPVEPAHAEARALRSR